MYSCKRGCKCSEHSVLNYVLKEELYLYHFVEVSVGHTFDYKHLIVCSKWPLQNVTSQGQNYNECSKKKESQDADNISA